MTRSADCTRASSVPQMAMPGWVADGGLGDVAGGHLRLQEGAVFVGAERGGGVGLGGEGVEEGEGGGAGVLLPEDVRAGGGTGGQRLGGGAVAGDVLGERQGGVGGEGGEGGAEPGDPGGVAVVGGPCGEGGPVDPGGAAAQAPAFEAGGEAEVGAARAGGAIDQRVLEEDQQVLGRQAGAGKGGEAAEEDAGGRQRQRAAGAVVGVEAPAAELGGDAAGEDAVGGDEGGAGAGLGGLAEARARWPGPRRAGPGPRPR